MMQIVPAVGLLVIVLCWFSSAQFVEVSLGSDVSLAGTRQLLNCSVNPPPMSASFMWLKDYKILETDSRVTVSGSLYSSILEFNPLRTSDGGQYQCVVTVMSGGAAVNITDKINLNVTSK